MDLSVVLKFALLLVRPGMVIAIAPGLSGSFIPAKVKIALTVFLALALLPSVQVAPEAGVTALTFVVARELAIGLSLAFALRVLIAGVEFAGHMGGHQIGFSYAATIDPQSGVRNNMVTMLYGSIATLTFLAIEGHHALLRALHASYAGLPIGAGQIGDSLVGSVRELLGLVFVVGFRLAAPIIIVMLIVEVAVGLISRAAPALNFLIIGFPVRLLVGMFLLGVLLPTISGVTTSLIGTAMDLAAATAVAFR